MKSVSGLSPLVITILVSPKIKMRIYAPFQSQATFFRSKPKEILPKIIEHARLGISAIRRPSPVNLNSLPSFLDE